MEAVRKLLAALEVPGRRSQAENALLDCSPSRRDAFHRWIFDHAADI